MRRIFVTAVLVSIVMCSSIGSLLAAEGIPEAWYLKPEAVDPKFLKVEAPQTAPDELTIQDAVRMAYRNNIGFRASIMSLLTARSNLYVVQQRWQLSASGGIQRNQSEDSGTTSTSFGAALALDPTGGTTISIGSELSWLDSESSTDLSMSIQKPLLQGAGKYSAASEQLRQARNSYRASLLNFFNARQTLTSQIISSYFNVIRQQRSVNIRRQGVARAEQSVNDSRLRLDAGLITELDLTQAELSLTQAQLGSVLIEQNAQDTMDQFLRMLGLKVGSNPTLVSEVTYDPADLDIDALVKQALEHHPDVALSLLSLEDSEFSYKNTRNQALPSLDAVAGYHQSWHDYNSSSWNVGLQLALPIASRAQSESVKLAEWNLWIARQERENLLQQIALDVRSQGHAVQAARTTVDIARKSRDIAQRSFKAAERMVQEGLRTNRDLVDAQNALTNSEIDLMNSYIDYYLATVTLRQSLGTDIAIDLPVGRIQQPVADKSEAPK